MYQDTVTTLHKNVCSVDPRSQTLKLNFDDIKCFFWNGEANKSKIWQSISAWFW